MKVGFDGILLGAWANVDNCQNVLDVGTGTGLIALMLAQRTKQREPATQVDAIEVNADAIVDASRNFAASPWSSRLNLIQARFQDWAKSHVQKYDLIVSNPPYFLSSGKDQPTSREIARQQAGLKYGDLIAGASALLRESGRLCVIVPMEQCDHVQGLAVDYGLTPVRKLEVRPIREKPPHRALLEFHRDSRGIATEVTVEELTIELSRHAYSDEFKELARDFYLAF